MTIAQMFNKEIEGERLLCSKSSNFSKEEVELVFNSVYRRIACNLFYTSMISKYLPMFKSQIIPQIGEDRQKEASYIKTHIVRHDNMYKDLIDEESDFGHYDAQRNYGLGKYANYFNEILNNDFDAEKLEEILSTESGYFIPLTRNVLVTANFLFVRYPEFYNDEYVTRLHEMIQFNDKKRILDKEELAQFTDAEKATLRHIKKYCQKRKTENKQLQKVKKNKKI